MELHDRGYTFYGQPGESATLKICPWTVEGKQSIPEEVHTAQGDRDSGINFNTANHCEKCDPTY